MLYKVITVTGSDQTLEETCKEMYKEGWLFLSAVYIGMTDYDDYIRSNRPTHKLFFAKINKEEEC